jgi:hypothetical protein
MIFSCEYIYVKLCNIPDQTYNSLNFFVAPRKLVALSVAILFSKSGVAEFQQPPPKVFRRSWIPDVQCWNRYLMAARVKAGNAIFPIG